MYSWNPCFLYAGLVQRATHSRDQIWVYLGASTDVHNGVFYGHAANASDEGSIAVQREVCVRLGSFALEGSHVMGRRGMVLLRQGNCL
jgi:hypothetical protein